MLPGISTILKPDRLNSKVKIPDLCQTSSVKKKAVTLTSYSFYSKMFILQDVDE